MVDEGAETRFGDAVDGDAVGAVSGGDGAAHGDGGGDGDGGGVSGAYGDGGAVDDGGGAVSGGTACTGAGDAGGGAGDASGGKAEESPSSAEAAAVRDNGGVFDDRDDLDRLTPGKCVLYVIVVGEGSGVDGRGGGGSGGGGGGVVVDDTVVFLLFLDAGPNDSTELFRRSGDAFVGLLLSSGDTRRGSLRFRRSEVLACSYPIETKIHHNASQGDCWYSETNSCRRFYRCCCGTVDSIQPRRQKRKVAGCNAF